MVPRHAHAAHLRSLAQPLGRPRDKAFDAAQALRLAQETFDIEAAAVLGLKARTDEAFARAVEQMLCVQGRVVVMGMGKSGHIGRKIAATLASTGTPALFVHPGRGQPRRPGHDHAGGPGAGDLQRRRKRRDDRDPAGAQAPGRAADRHDRRAASRRWRCMPTSCWTAASKRKPARSTWRPRPAPRPSSRWATRWRWRCSMRAASAARTSRAPIPAARWAASCSRTWAT